MILYVFTYLAIIHIIVTWLLSVQKGWSAKKRRNWVSITRESPDQYPFVSIIIPAWNEQRGLSSCISSIKNVVYPVFEVIIVAGGDDGTFEEARLITKTCKNCHVLEQQPGGKNHALNQGLQKSKGEIIVLLDADSVVTKDWLKELVAPVILGNRAVTGRSLPLRNTAISLFEQMEKISAYEVHHSVILQGNSSIALHRSTINQLGGFPEDIKVGVDWDLDIRLLKLGIPKLYANEALIYTERPATISEFFRNEIRWRRAHLNSIFFHYDKFFKNFFSVFYSLYIYVLAFFTVAFTIMAIIAALFSFDWLLQLWPVFILWLLLRRAALTGEIIAYTGQWRWIKICWVPPLLLYLTFIAIILATLSLRKKVVHFKGPRVEMNANPGGNK